MTGWLPEFPAVTPSAFRPRYLAPGVDKTPFQKTVTDLSF
jgi:hypothetical protein